MKEITETALVKRINRKLAPDFEKLRKSRGAREQMGMGEYYVHDCKRNSVMATYVDPVRLGRELGVLQNRETVVP